jgi:hypothetical protein
MVVMHRAVEFGSGLRAKLAREAPAATNDDGDHRLFRSVDLRPFYELLTREALIFRDFAPTAPRPRRKWSQRLL